MNRRPIVRRFVGAIVGSLFACIGNGAGVDGLERDLWQDAHPFTKRLDAGAISGEPIDPRNPPPLSVWLLSGNSDDLRAMADYFNLGSKRVTLQGRKIKDSTGDAERFYPFARLEVANQMDHEWQVIGHSPPETSGVAAAAVMAPVKVGVVNKKAKSNPSCMIDMKPFKKFVRKFRYARIVLQDGETSQVIGLDDLKPPKDAFR